MIPLINGISELWLAYMGSAAFQATLLALFVLAMLRVGRHWPPALRHAILMLAMCKFLVPPTLSVPTGVFSRIRPQEWFQSGPAWRYVAPALHYETRPLQGIKSSARHSSSVQDPWNKYRDSGTSRILPPQKPSITTKGKLLLLYCSGLLLILFLAALQQLYLRRLALRGTPVKDPGLEELYGALCRSMRIRRRPRLLISAENHAPVTFGVWKPVVILPQAIVTALPPEEIRTILGHELAHHRRRDPWLLRLHIIVSAIWWFNPVYWLLSRTVRRVREDCCDDMVVAAGIASRESYCRTLLRAARLTCCSPAAGAVLAYFGEPHPLHRRFNRIMTAKSIAFPRLAGWGMLAVSALALLLLPGIKPRALAQSAARSEASPQNMNSAQPQRSIVLQTADKSSKAASRSLEGEQNGLTEETAISNYYYYRKWLEEDVVYIITPEEKNGFLSLRNDRERESFIEQFWARRNPNPRNVDNAFKEEHYRRIAYANEHFASGIPGWKTDRGRIYIIYGKPDELESHPTGGAHKRPFNEGGGTTTTYPFEKWWYRHIEGVGDDIELEFVDKSGKGEYRMAMSPDEKDALVNVPNGGMTSAEEMGLADKADRVNPSASNDPNNPNGSPFGRMEQYFEREQYFEDLKSIVTTHRTYNSLPYDIQTDYIKLSADKVLVPITIEISNRDLEFKKELDSNRAAVMVYGLVTSLNNKILSEWEETVSVEYLDQHVEQGRSKRSEYQKIVALPPGQRYKLDLVLKDVNSNKAGTRSLELNVPEY